MKQAFDEMGISRENLGLSLLERASRLKRGGAARGHRGIARSLDFMASHYLRPFRVLELADVAGLSRRGFLKAFKKHVGICPGKLLTHARVEEARRLLADSNLPLSQVAERCGYRRANSFWVAFRRIVGVAPGVFRRQSRQSNPPRRR